MMVMQQPTTQNMDINIYDIDAAKNSFFEKLIRFVWLHKGRTKSVTCIALTIYPPATSYIYMYTYFDTLQTLRAFARYIELWIRIVLMLGAFQANADEHITRAK